MALARAVAIRDEVSRSPDLPERVLGYLDALVGELEASEPVASHLSTSGHGLMQWYLDQGFADVPLHAEIADLARDVLKLTEG